MKKGKCFCVYEVQKTKNPFFTLDPFTKNTKNTYQKCKKAINGGSANRSEHSFRSDRKEGQNTWQQWDYSDDDERKGVEWQSEERWAGQQAWGMCESHTFW